MRERIRAVAESMGLVEADGELVRLDSLTMLDFAEALQSKLEVHVPASELLEANFRTFATVEQMVSRLTAT